MSLRDGHLTKRANLAKLPTGKKFARGYTKLSNDMYGREPLKWKILLLSIAFT